MWQKKKRRKRVLSLWIYAPDDLLAKVIFLIVFINDFTTLSGFFAPTFAWKLSLGVKLCNCSPARGWRADACLHTAEVSLGITSSTATFLPSRSGHVWLICKVLSERCVLISFQMSQAWFTQKEAVIGLKSAQSALNPQFWEAGGIVFVILRLLV